MEINVTETFERTYDMFNLQCTESEYEKKLRLHIEEKLPGKPTTNRYRQIVSMGGSRSSKSYSILQILLLEIVKRKNLRVVVWRNLKNVCRSSVMEDFKKIIMFDQQIYSQIKHNKQEGSFTFLPTKSKIVFDGADNIGKVLGGTQDISFFNEVTEFSKEVYLQIRQRTADRIFCDYNPSKSFWLESYRFDESSVFIHSTFLHNAYCPPEIRVDLLAYEPWEPESYEVNGFELTYNGHPISKTNQPPPHERNVRKGTANEFMWLVYGLGIGADKPNKIYRGWRPITSEQFDEQEYESYFGLDFGTSNPTACMDVKYDGDGAFYIRERLYKPLQDIGESLPTVIKTQVRVIDRNTSYLICDSAKQKYIDLLENEGYMAIGAVKGGGSVELGITLLQGFTIYYVPSENLKYEYDNYAWQLDRYEKSTDKPLKVDDHLMDALRYVVTWLIDYLDIKV